MGYMGSGKSAIGQCIASLMQREFVDLDKVIEQSVGLSIPEIFEQKGAIYFRKRESEILRQLMSSSSESIIALGGGTPIYGDNLTLINDPVKNFSVYLKISIEPLVQRLWSDRHHRPIIAGINSIEDLEDFVRKHLFERTFVYQQADLVFDVSEMALEPAAARIIASFTERERNWSSI